MKKIDEILEKYPELNSNRKTELKEELLSFVDINNRVINILTWLADSPYTIDSASVPKMGIDVAPQQVVGILSLGYLKYKELCDLAKKYK